MEKRLSFSNSHKSEKVGMIVVITQLKEKKMSSDPREK
jgi:hypothetical protein